MGGAFASNSNSSHSGNKGANSGSQKQGPVDMKPKTDIKADVNYKDNKGINSKTKK